MTMLLASAFAAPSVQAEPKHGIAMHGELKLPADFTHFPYTNPNAIKGGTLRLGALGSYDSLNPLIHKGVVAPKIRGYIYQSLLARSLAEPFSLYGLLAEKVETPDDRSWIAFTLNPKAKFSDGKPVTVDDVMHSWEILRDKGRNNHRTYYKKVAKAEKTGPRTVKFSFADGTDREMALIMGLMPVVPKHALGVEKLQKTTLSPPLGSGPYLISKVDPGRSITFKRNPDYWAKDIPSMRGRYNFDTVHYDFFRDVNSLREAFSKGVYAVRSEGDPAKWALSYDFPAVTRGDVIKRTFPVGLPSGMSGLVFNTRRSLFADNRVREALTFMFDFEWLNQKLYNGLYVRTQSFFDRSSLSSHGKPATDLEKELLGANATKIPSAIMDGTFSFPQTDGRGRNRKNLRKALALLKEAGYEIRDRRIINVTTGTPMAFEILIATQAHQKMLTNFANTLRRVGIDVTVRQVESTEYERRRQSFDFDIRPFVWGGSLSPGNEQYYRWASSSADANGSFNLAGVKNPAVDAMIDAMVAARDRKTFEAAVRAYDRTLLAGHYVIPLYHLPEQWVAHWKHLAFPEQTSLWGYQLDTWWDTRASQN